MFKSSDFQVNQTWVIFVLNEAPIETQQDGDFNVIAIMDAASQYILMTEFISIHSEELSDLDSRRMLKKCWSYNKQFPEKLLVSSALKNINNFTRSAERKDIVVDYVPERDLMAIIGEAMESFGANISRGRVQ